ncbi:unnamed protein product [Adineta steineri]|uniref:FIP-RBD domain-containing protein n=1 Tax=Adineta steineri TaxID=433720 RepID=A0A813Y7I1_9BILA|nr:unnamed protein product [Adineta steineri]
MMEFDLKEVFSILDENDEGQIQLRRFVDVANNYYSDAEQLARITKALDPTNTGLINFDQFCQGIAQISSLQGVSLKDVATDLSRLSRENSLAEDSDQRSLLLSINKQLHEYIDSLLLQILLHNPTLLEKH